MPSPWFFVAVAIGSTTGAHLLFKLHAIGGGRAKLVAALGLFSVVPLANFVALRNLPLAQVYLCTATVPVLGLLVGRFVLDERVTRNGVLSTALIVAGIVLYQAADLLP